MILHLIFAWGFACFSPSPTVPLYADYINGAKLPKKFLPNVHNVKINEFLIGCCKKKNCFLISAQPSKNLPSLRNRVQTHCRQWTEEQRAGKVILRMKFLLSPPCPSPALQEVWPVTNPATWPGRDPAFQESSSLPAQGPWDLPEHHPVVLSIRALLLSLAWQPWASYLTSLNLQSLICKIIIILHFVGFAGGIMGWIMFPLKFICWSPSLQCLRMGPFLETGSLQRSSS